MATDMRATWSGSISFGLINIPVKQYAGIEDNKIRFTTVHKTCMKPIKKSLEAGATAACSSCNKSLGKDDVVKAWEVEGGRYVEINESELDAVALQGSKEMEITKFVKADSIDPMYMDSFNLLAPEGTARGYMTLAQALYEQEAGAIARQIKGGQDYIWLLRALPFKKQTIAGKKDHVVTMYVLGMTKLRRASEVRTQYAEVIADELVRKADGNYPLETEMELAKKLIELNFGEYDAKEYVDRRQLALHEIVVAAQAGKKLKPVKAKKPEPEVGDLMAALRASVKDAEKRAVKSAA